METQPRLRRDVEAERKIEAPTVVYSATLFDGRRELLIRHGDDTLYRLRVTASNKLILTK